MMTRSGGIGRGLGGTLWGIGGALRENERRFRDFAAAASDWFWEQDAELRFTRVSGSLATAAGREANRRVVLRIDALMR